MDEEDLYKASQIPVGEPSRVVRDYCGFLWNHGGDYTWGYAIFRTAYYDGSDAEFKKALDILNDYLQYACFEDVDSSADRNRQSPAADSTPNEQLAQRLRNIAIEDPNLEGMALEEISQRFKEWIRDQGREIEETPQYRFCLVIDEEVLKTMIRLPPPAEFLGDDLTFSVKVIDVEENEYDNPPVWDRWFWADCMGLVELWYLFSECAAEELRGERNGKPLFTRSCDWL